LLIGGGAVPKALLKCGEQVRFDDVVMNLSHLFFKGGHLFCHPRWNKKASHMNQVQRHSSKYPHRRDGSLTGRMHCDNLGMWVSGLYQLASSLDPNFPNSQPPLSNSVSHLISKKLSFARCCCELFLEPSLKSHLLQPNLPNSLQASLLLLLAMPYSLLKRFSSITHRFMGSLYLISLTYYYIPDQTIGQG